MKKRLLSLLLAVATAVSLLVVPAGAASARRFSDVTEETTAIHAEVLRLMGVMDGYGDGTFRPSGVLTRAQFCKMATYAMHQQERLGLYRTVTVFPDVKPSYWAAPYINLAAQTPVGEEKGGRVIAGFADGRFHPESEVTMGQAVTILLRILGYQDSAVGGVWPDSFMATGQVCGLLDGITASAYAPVTRAQAAQLFVNLLRAKAPGGGTLYPVEEEEVSLLDVDGGLGTVKVTGRDPIKMIHPVEDTGLQGMNGQLVMLDGKVLTFLPSSGTGGVGSAAGAMVIYDSRSAEGLKELAGNSSYKLYKNGSPASVNDLQRYDVATYYPETNSIVVCDTKVSVYYEDCEPAPAAPATIRVLGTTFQVLPTAQASLSQFRPGDKMTILLTADGRVAAALEEKTVRGNALGLVDSTGKIKLFCGSSTVELGAAAGEEFLNQVVTISSVKKDEIQLFVPKGGTKGDLNVETGKLGGKKLAENVAIYENGQQISLSALDRDVIDAEKIQYSHTNWAGEVDLVVINRTTGKFYGRVRAYNVKHDAEIGEDGSVQRPAYSETMIAVEYDGGQAGPFKSGNAVRTGDFVIAAVKGQNFSFMKKLEQVKKVPATAWIGETMVQAADKTYQVPADVQCYDAHSGNWMSLEKALRSGSALNLYVDDGGVVRIVEIP